MMEKGFTYVIDGDGVYFDVSKKKDYGKLSHYKLDELEAGGGERKASYEGKRNPGDFAVWKFRKEENLSGHHHGVKEDRAGILSVPL